MNISLCCPSYRRPIVETLRYLPQCRVYVDPGEIDAYRGANRNADIVACDPGIQGNLCRVRNHIIDRELANGADAVVIVDDDMRKIGFFENGKGHRMLAGSDIMPFLEKYTIMARDLGAYLWGISTVR